MLQHDIAFMSTLELRTLIKDKQISPVEVTKIYLNRIEKLDSELNSYITVTADEAIRSAKLAEDAIVRGENLGLLHGIPISIKDLESTKGILSTSGSIIFKDRVPDADSIVVERVRQAGAVILGKTNTPEFGVLAHTENRLGDHCRNPWDTALTTGGSSGGAAAAVASGLCSIATGSDGGGSIRIPASFCGVYGIKPTQGRVPRSFGSQTVVVANQFSQSGPISRTVRDSAILLQIMSGNDSRDPISLKDNADDYLGSADKMVDGLKIGWSPDFGFANVDAEVLNITEKSSQVFQDLGCLVESAYIRLDSPFDTFWPLFSANIYSTFGRLLTSHPDELTWYARVCLEEGAKVTGADYAKALGGSDKIKAHFDDLFDHFDLLVSPTLAVTAFPVGEPPKTIADEDANWFWGYLPFTFPINLIGHPAANIPCGFDSKGLPVGLQIIGRKGDESTVIAASAAFEMAKPWIDYRPKVS